MKIHTMQDLNLVHNQQLSSSVSQTRDRKKEYIQDVNSGHMYMQPLQYSSSLTFGIGRKGPVIRNGKKVIESVNKVVGDIAREATPEKKKGDSFLNSPHFNRVLDVVGFETVVTATVAAIACAARAGTILALPTKKNKDDNNYAAGQAGASGIIGFITAFILTAPFKAGSDYVMKELKQNLNAKTLKRLYPHINLESIEKNGKRLPISEWKDYANNKFLSDMKECERLPKLRNLADVSEKTFQKILHLDVDWASQKGKSFNNVTLKNGKNLYDEIDMSKLGIVVNEEGMPETQILLKDINKVYFERLLESAREDKTYWGKLDLKSVYDEADKVKDFREWKDINGNQWKLNLDEIGISSPYETADYRNRITGKKRFDVKDGEYKFVTYQANRDDGNLGTEITQKMVDADRANDGLFKLLTWGPDLLFRVPVAATTVAIIPWVMKNVFRLEKSSDKKNVSENQVNQLNKTNAKEGEQVKNQSVSFKGGASGKHWTPKILDPVGKFFGKLYGRALIESEGVHTVSKKLSRLPGNVTEHMSALGSLITSGVYVHQTLTKKDIDPDRRRTLAVNQGLCFAVPTAAAYTVNQMINKWVKNKGYRYSGLNQRKIDIATLENKDSAMIKKDAENLGKRLKGIRTLAAITVFTLIYRYATPVLITPLANKIGNMWNAKLVAKRKAEAEAEARRVA